LFREFNIVGNITGNPAFVEAQRFEQSPQMPRRAGVLIEVYRQAHRQTALRLL
jgi:hypothetical protein